MRVILRCQSEMSGTFCRIPRLFHGTQGQTTDQCLFRRICNSGEEFLQFFWMDFVLDTFQSISEIADKFCKCLDFSGSGVSWTRYKNGISCQKYSDATVSFAKQHKIFDNLCRCICLVWSDINRFSFFIQDNLCFRKIKVDRTACMAVLRSSSDSSLIFSNIGTNS